MVEPRRASRAPGSRRRRFAATRRGVLAGLIVLPALAACEDDADSSHQPRTAPELPDDDIVGRAAQTMAEASLLCSATMARHPELARVCRAFRELHATHLAVLEQSDAIDEADPPPNVARNQAVARTALMTSENGVSATLSDLALEADSGQLARALGSMSAAVLQRLTR